MLTNSISVPGLPKRKHLPLYFHDGFLFRHVKTLTNGSELLYCDKRKTPIACNALAYRKDGIIEVKRGHHGHERQDALANAKLVRYSIRQSAVNSDASTSDIIRNAHDAFGDSISMTCTQQSLARMINRARQPAPERKLDWGGNEEHAIFDESAVKNEPQSPGPEMGGQYGDMTGDVPNLDSILQSCFDQTMTIPTVNFLGVVRQTISDQVRQSHSEIVEEIRSVMASSSAKSVDGTSTVSPTLESSMLTFLSSLQSLADASQNLDLKNRFYAVLNRGTIEVNNDDVLEAVLNCIRA